MSKCTPKRPAKQLPNGDVEIILTQGYVTIVSPEDAELAQINWRCLKGKGRFYAHRNHPNTLMHRVIMGRMLGRSLLDSERVDHKEGVGLDNRRSNLRLCTQAENSRNRTMSKSNTTGYKGVYREGKRFLAAIGYNYKLIRLGTFSTAEEAHRAYCEASAKYHGEYGRTK